MRSPINLASQPFRRDRAMLAASIAVTVLLCVTLGVLVSLALADRAQLADVRGDIDRLNRQIRRVSAEQSQQDTVLRKPENAEVLEHSVFFNDLLRRKVAAESPEPVIQLLTTMSQAPFGNPELKLMQAPSQSEPLYRYRVSVEYAQKL